MVGSMDWKFRQEVTIQHHEASEELFRVTEFSNRIAQPLLIIFLAYSSFDEFI